MNPENIKIGVYYPDNAHLSMKIYADTIIEHLSALGFTFRKFKQVDELPGQQDVYWDPRVGGGEVPEINKSHTQTAIVATLHGAALFSLPIRENSFLLKDTMKILRYRRWFRSGWKLYKNHYEKIITVSEYAKAEIAQYLPVSPDLIVPVYHAVDKSLFHPSGQKNKRIEKYILHVSVYQPKKNIDRIIKAYNSLDKQDTWPKLIVVAPGYKKEVKNKNIVIIREKLSRHQVAEYMQNAYGFIMPSLHESFGLPILEAMACGVPVITSNTTGCPEIAGDAAMLVNPRKTKEIASAMKTLFRNDALREKLIKKGLERVNEFSWEKSAAKHGEVFREAFQNQKFSTNA